MQPKHLLMSWAAYWLGLGVATVWKPVSLAWRVSRPSAKGSISAGYGDGAINLKMVMDGVTTYTASVNVSTMLLWIAVPPLVLWLGWFLLRSRNPPGVGAARVVDALAPGSGPMDPLADARDRVPVDERSTE